MPSRVNFVFNDAVTGSMGKPSASLLDQHSGIVLNVSAGLPWSQTLPQSGPHKMMVSEV